MTYKNSWYVPGRIVLSEHFAKLNADQLKTIDEEMIGYLDEGTSALVHFIVDLTAVDEVPDLKSSTGLKFGKHAKMGWLILVGEVSPLMRFLVTTATQIVRVRFRSFKTRTEAHDFLYDIDSTLPEPERLGEEDESSIIDA